MVNYSTFHQHAAAFGDRSFAVAGPRLWNSLPTNLWQMTSYRQFRRHLKSYLLWSFSNHCVLWLWFRFVRYRSTVTYLLTYWTLVVGPYFRVKQRGVSLSYKSKVYRADSGSRPLFMELSRPVRVAGDVRLEFFNGKGAAKVNGVPVLGRSAGQHGPLTAN